jgi:DNA-binding transcriptional ArsR family regulator
MTNRVVPDRSTADRSTADRSADDVAARGRSARDRARWNRSGRDDAAHLDEDFGDDLQVGRVFKALADPTRRRIIQRLGRSAASTSDLAAGSDMAMPSFLQHLRLLEDCGLVASHKQGRVRTYRLTPEPLERVGGWLDQQRSVWERRLDQLDTHLVSMATSEEDDR